MNNEVSGIIGYYNLTTWRESTFTENERNEIISTFQPLSLSFELPSEEYKSILISGDYKSTENAVSFLSTLSGRFGKENNRTIAYRLLEKADEFVDENTDLLDLHFLELAKIRSYYRWRDIDKFAFEKALKACLKQIEIAPLTMGAFKKEYPNSQLPSHTGYEQLCIIKEKNKDYEEAIELANLAKMQGRGGDWEKRILRCEKKLQKLK